MSEPWVLRAAGDPPVNDVVLAVHGGTGLDRKDVTPELDREFRAALTAALKAGQARWLAGGSSLEMVTAAVVVLEDAPSLNAGRGAVFTREGRHELDASLMDGRDRRAGAVAGVQIVKNPILAAEAVMKHSPHVMLIGRGAEVFATQHQVEIVDPSYFWTEMRWKSIQEYWREHPPAGARPAPPPAAPQPEPAATTSASISAPGSATKAETGFGRVAGESPAPLPRRKNEYGTVGAVALDQQGHLAAGTSTGGMTGKMSGRVGDSPIIGAGTYADDQAAAVSCTGHGEFFIRFAVAHEIVSQVRYAKASVDIAADDVINRQLKAAGGEGAAIVLSPQGIFTAAYNSEGLYRGYLTKSGEIVVRLYED
jgi:L-asparaginase / beta-aspartyl-peptidase